LVQHLTRNQFTLPTSGGVSQQIGGLAMGPSNHGRRNEPLRRGDEHDEYDEVPGEVSSLLEENARLRGLVVELSRMIRKGVAEQG
jgi:hypothetical protein